MSWLLLLALVLALGIALFAAISRRHELVRMEQRLEERSRAVRHTNAAAQLQYPVVDLSRCLGCGSCVAACPEEGVLDLVHGQAVVVNGSRCVGHASCERECPVGAIQVTIANLDKRNDVPVLSDGLEAVGSPNLFLAGEVTAHALIKTAIEHGTAVAAEVARRVADAPRHGDTFDLCIVGAGPAGLACSLEAKRHGLSFVTIDQELAAGGTVAKYPRRKLVMMQPVELPLHGRLGQTTYTKEELVELWQRIAEEQALPIRTGEVFQGVETTRDGGYVVRTATKAYAARHVCIALGRRGTPNKLGVPGEDLPKVAYSLLDARSYQGRKILVVGGGDSAVEAAVGLAEQPGNDVTLSYRRDAFFRIRARNEERLRASVAHGKLRVLLKSQVRAIRADTADLEIENGARSERLSLPNDEVFVMAGGVAPFELLGRSGVSFDASLRKPAEAIVERGTGLTKALAIGFALSLFALAFALWHSDYYFLERGERAASAKHAFLRSGRGVGLWLGIGATVLIAVNLLYLVRRSPRFRFQFGSLSLWMTSHVATGILALLCATLHGAMSPRDTVGGHAFLALAVLLVTGAIGRYFYAYLPRAANGRELEIEEVKLQLDRMIESWDKSQRAFVENVQARLAAMIQSQQWRTSFFGRALGLVRGERELDLVLADLAREGARQGVPEDRVQETLHLAKRAHRTALAAAHYEDLRALLGSWRYLHRWIAVLMVVLIVLHVVYVLTYGSSMLEGRLT